MDDKIMYLTKEGLENLKIELADLIENKRPKNIEDIRENRSLGDLSENGGYQAAMEEQTFIERRIKEIENTLKVARVKKEKLTNTVGIGSRVSVQLPNSSSTIVYEIVGATEADPLVQKISYESPIGKSLFGGKEGDTVSVETPGGVMSYKITKVE